MHNWRKNTVCLQIMDSKNKGYLPWTSRLSYFISRWHFSLESLRSNVVSTYWCVWLGVTVCCCCCGNSVGKKNFNYWSRCRRYYYYSPLESSAALIFFSPHPTKLRRTLYLLFLDSEVFLCPVYLHFMPVLACLLFNASDSDPVCK